jgi:hypothetical protein
MKRVLILIGAALLVSPAVASAKGPIDEATACGTDGCTTVALPPGAKEPDGMMLLFGMAPTTQPSPGPYYRLRISAEGEQWTSFYTDGKIGDGAADAWATVQEPLRSAIDRALAGHPPYQHHLPAVFVDGRKSGDPAAFAPILGTLPEAADSGEIARHAERWVPITFVGPDPWASITGFYDPRTGSMYMPDSGSRWMRVPPSVQSEITRMIGVASTVAPSRDSSRWQLWTGLGALAAVGLLVAAWLWRRSRPRAARVA